MRQKNFFVVPVDETLGRSVGVPIGETVGLLVGVLVGETLGQLVGLTGIRVLAYIYATLLMSFIEGLLYL